MTESRKRKKDSRKALNKELVPKPTNLPKKKEEVMAGRDIWSPGSYLAFKAFLSARFCAAIWGLINDCDETYNYWEPTHFLLAGKGFQTWEYSPAYALRSYTYLLLHVLPAFIYDTLFQPSHILTFFSVRCVLALCCSALELYFYKGICKKFGTNVSRIYLAVSVFAAGMFNSSVAYLPSSFAMYMTLLSYGGWFCNNFKIAIFGTALSTFLGWPFAILNGIPIAIDILFIRKKVKLFVNWVVISASVILVPMLMIDSFYFGKTTLAPLNIVWYNVFTSHGPNLYGTESSSFYAINLFLNFNVSFLLGVFGLPLVFIGTRIFSSYNFVKVSASERTPIFLYLSPLLIWFAVFNTQDHKEERFLFPIYPIIVVSSAFVVDYCQRILFKVRGALKSHYTHNTNFVSVAFIIVTSLVSMSRIVGQYRAYHAPLSTFLKFHHLDFEGRIPNLRTVNVCLGREWHRFPSSFFLPNENWNILFIESEFRGQLPKPFSSLPNATRIIPTNMNDLNKEEVTRYSPLSRCHFIVDVDRTEETEREPRYSITNQWNVINSIPFLEKSKSNVFLRAFYVPFLTESYCSYVDYVILMSNKLKLIEN